ncbi:hypothetical protein QTP88_017505 [Uroleucon formosanum]
MWLEAISGSELSAIIALSSAKLPVIIWLVVGWSEMYRLNKSKATTEPWGTPTWMGFIQIRLNQSVHQSYCFRETEIHFPSKISTQSGKSRGRPSTSFHDSSDRSKRRKTEQLRTQYSPTMLSYAAQMSLRKSGNVDSAYVIKNITCTTPTRASKYKKSYKDSKNKIKVISNDEALSLLIEAQLTKHQYNLVRTRAKKHGCNIYPAYHLLRYAKNECYPDKSCLQITESCAEVKLQALLDITTQRVLKSQGQGSIIDSVSDKYFEKLYLISKWGCDGSSQQSEYKQVFNSECDSDSSIFFTSVVPLQLVSGDIDGPNKIILWQNPRPSSPRYYRPIKIQFIHETVDITLQEKKRIQEDFKSKLGLLVDIPKCGYGTSNDGNTARRFFENTEMSSSITGVDIEIINRFKIVLLTISSGYKIDLKKIKNLEDVFNRLLVSSDPLISSLRQLPQKKIKHIHPEVLEMILPPDINIKTIKTKGTESDISSENEVSTSSSE